MLRGHCFRSGADNTARPARTGVSAPHDPRSLVPVNRSPVDGVTSGSIDQANSSLFWKSEPHSREAEFPCLGLQSYSCLWGLSRGKHHMLYPNNDGLGAGLRPYFPHKPKSRWAKWLW
jgi:hypothetical protein